MKRLMMTIIMIAMASGVYAQNTFFAQKAGIVLTYANNGSNGKPTGYSVMTIKNVEGSGGNMAITYGVESLDKNRKPPKESPGEQVFKVIVKDGVMILDMNQMIPAEMMKDMGISMKISGLPMELPTDLQPGQSIKDANVTLELDMGIMKMSTVIKMTDGECLAIEDVTVPAGTFKSHKITQTVSTTVMKMNTSAKTLSWYSPGIGTVKTETYDSKNKLTGSTELVELKGN